MPTPTTRNGFRKPDPGSDNNTWGVNLNGAVFDLTDDSLDGWVNITTGGATTLTGTQYVANQARMRVIKYSASTPGTITIPSVEKWYLVYAVSAPVTITTGGSTTATIEAGDLAPVVCDGFNCIKVQSNNFGGDEIVGLGTPTSNSSAATKSYVDGIAFQTTGNLPGINSGTAGQFVTNDGISTANWGEVVPVRTSGTLNQILKSLGNSAGSLTSTVWDWDGYQGQLSKSANYTVVLGDRSKWIYCTATLTLALTAASTLGSKFIIRVINSSATDLVTIDPNGSELINGATTLLVGPGESWDITCTGTAFNAVCVVQQLAGPHVIAQNVQASGSSSGETSLGLDGVIITRTLNTLVRNTVGASLASNAVTLPIGTWYIEAVAPGHGLSKSRLVLYNVTDSTSAVIGRNGFVYKDVTISTDNDVFLEGVITVTSPKAFQVRQYCGTTSGLSTDFGSPITDGNSEIYTELRATRIST